MSLKHELMLTFPQTHNTTAKNTLRVCQIKKKRKRKAENFEVYNHYN